MHRVRLLDVCTSMLEENGFGQSAAECRRDANEDNDNWFLCHYQSMLEMLKEQAWTIHTMKMANVRRLRPSEN